MPLKGFNKLNRRLHNMQRDMTRKPESAAKRGLRTTMGIAKVIITDRDAIASGELKQSFVIRDSDRLGKKRVRLVNTSAHAAFVEYGIGQKGTVTPDGKKFKAPSFTPRFVSVIYRWSIIKGIVPTQISREGFSFIVARRIAGKEAGEPSGIVPKYFMTGAWRATKEQTKQDIQKAVKDSV